MTDNEIIKVLECCLEDDYKCNECPLYADCDSEAIAKHSLDLINRQKAKIKSLKQNIEALTICKKDLPQKTTNTIKTEVVREFIKRFEKEIGDVEFTIGQFCEIKSTLKYVEKEMVGEFR